MVLLPKVVPLVLTAIAGIPAGASAQTTTQPGTGLILGRVVDGETGRPISTAIVSLGCVGANPPARDRVRTDGQGRFVFLPLPPGTHSLCVIRTGYTLGSPARVTLAAGQHLADLVLRLMATARSGSISGTVVDEHGEPAVGVRLLLLTRNAGGSGPRFWQRGGATTDDRGAFRVSAVSAGQYVIMTPSALVGVPGSTLETVETLRRANTSTAELQRQLSSIGAVSGNLPPPPAGSAERLEVGDSVLPLGRLARPPVPAPNGRWLVYPTQFHPGTTSFASATRIDLDEGEVRSGLQMQLRPVPAVRVSGTLTGPAGAGANLAVQLVAADADGLQADLAVASTISDGSARFLFPVVPAGEYAIKVIDVPRLSSLRSTSTTIETPTGALTVPSTTRVAPPSLPADPTLWARQPLSVGDSDIEGVTVALSIGARVSGRLEFDGPSPRPTPAQIASLRLNVMRPSGRSIAGDMAPGTSAVNPAARIEGDGSFATQGLPGGPYLFAILTPPPGWFFRGAMLSGRDVSETPLDLGPEDVRDLVLTLTDRPTILAGGIRDRGGAAAPAGSYVLAFPVDPARWRNYGTTSRRIALARTTDGGQYEFRHLPPGEYFAIATGAGAPRDYQAAETLESLARLATRVRLREGVRTTADLQVVHR
jgi:hypothetical protein